MADSSALPEKMRTEDEGCAALDQKLCDAMSRKDIDAAMSCFWDNPDLMVVLNGAVHRGTDEVRQSFQQLFDSNEEISLEVNDVEHVNTGDTIMAVGTATYTLKPKKGNPQLVVERWSDIRRKVGGKWVYVMDHTTHLDE